MPFNNFYINPEKALYFVENDKCFHFPMQEVFNRHLRSNLSHTFEMSGHTFNLTFFKLSVHELVKYFYGSMAYVYSSKWLME